MRRLKTVVWKKEDPARVLPPHLLPAACPKACCSCTPWPSKVPKKSQGGPRCVPGPLQLSQTAFHEHLGARKWSDSTSRRHPPLRWAAAARRRPLQPLSFCDQFLKPALQQTPKSRSRMLGSTSLQAWWPLWAVTGVTVGSMWVWWRRKASQVGAPYHTTPAHCSVPFHA